MKNTDTKVDPVKYGAGYDLAFGRKKPLAPDCEPVLLTAFDIWIQGMDWGTEENPYDDE